MLKMRRSESAEDESWIQPVQISHQDGEKNVTRSIVLCYNGELYGLDSDVWNSVKNCIHPSLVEMVEDWDQSLGDTELITRILHQIVMQDLPIE